MPINIPIAKFMLVFFHRKNGEVKSRSVTKHKIATLVHYINPNFLSSSSLTPSVFAAFKTFFVLLLLVIVSFLTSSLTVLTFFCRFFSSILSNLFSKSSRRRSISSQISNTCLSVRLKGLIYVCVKILLFHFWCDRCKSSTIAYEIQSQLLFLLRYFLALCITHICHIYDSQSRKFFSVPRDLEINHLFYQVGIFYISFLYLCRRQDLNLH